MFSLQVGDDLQTEYELAMTTLLNNLSSAWH